MDHKGAQMLVALITPSRPRPGSNEVILSFINLLPQEIPFKLQEQTQDRPYLYPSIRNIMSAQNSAAQGVQAQQPGGAKISPKVLLIAMVSTYQLL